MMSNMVQDSAKTVLVFGVFDMLHPGHVYFLMEALKLGEELHVCLATDEFVKEIKNKNPNFSYYDRQKGLKSAFPSIIIHKGDNVPGEWSIFKKLSPNIIALGHDQNELKNELQKLNLSNVEIVTVEPFKKNIYSTTLLSKEN